jgi:hypothetical protein
MPKKNPKPAFEVGEPEFVPWDGTKKPWTRPARANIKAKKFNSVPSMVVDLVLKHDGNVSAAGRACGVTGNTIMSLIEGVTAFDDKRQRIVFEGLHGIRPPRAKEPEGYDEYRKGMAICVIPAKNFDRVRDVADLLKGSIMFKLSTTAGWLVIYELTPQAARNFKRIAARDCTKLFCP